MSNLDKFLTGIAMRNDRLESTFGSGVRLRRVEFSYRGRKYVAIRFRAGRPELYRVEKDGRTRDVPRLPAAGDVEARRPRRRGG